MNVEIINVGTELLLGEIVNTNATYIQKMCKELGLNVFHQSVVGDNPERFKECLQIAFNRGADCVITTGGLGPTQDDLTKELSAEYLGLPLEYSKEEAKKVDEKCKFVTMWDSVPENNFKQANFPPNAYILENEVGTANGCVMSNADKMIINLPGPPKEMSYVIEHSLKPYLEKYKDDVIYTFEYITIGIGESRIDDLLKDIIASQKDISIALYAGEEYVRVRLAIKCASQDEANKLMQPIKDKIESILDKYIVREDNIKNALYKIMPAYHFRYLTEFKLPQDYQLGENYQEDSKFVITIDCQKEKLGDIIIVDINDGKTQEEVKIPLLKDANLSMAKLLAKITNSVYAFIKEKELISGMD